MSEPPPPTDSPSVTELGRVVEACEHFEDEWRAGRRPRVEDFLGRVAGPARPALVRDLLRLDLEYRRKAGEVPTAQEYGERLGEYAPVIRAVFTAPETPAPVSGATPRAPEATSPDGPPLTSPDLGATALDVSPRRGVTLRAATSSGWNCPTTTCRWRCPHGRGVTWWRG
jgi:hypothetical protein